MMERIVRALEIVAIAVLTCTGSTSHASPAGGAMEKTDKTNRESIVKRAAAAENRWKESDVVVRPLDRIELPPCRFYAVHDATEPGPASTYALLPDGKVVGQSDRRALDAIFAACAPRAASASTWAELVARFHPDVAPGDVIDRAEPPLGAGDPPSAVDAPVITDGKLRFHLKNRETQAHFVVTAVVGDRGVASVTKTKLGR
ncbi:hypothetical protein L6R52_35700 [Myxococcota bacterium]|nr:hypothetical protein [Myxococcota bacterium]